MNQVLGVFLVVVLALSTAGCSVAEDSFDNGTDLLEVLSTQTYVETRPGDFKIASGGYEALRERGFKPRADLDSVKLSVPVEWKMDPFRDNNWRFQFQAWRMLNPLWGEYQKSGEGALLGEIWGFMRDWGEFHVVADQNSRYAWQDMATGIRAQHLGYMHKLKAEGVWAPSPADEELLDSMTMAHVARLFEESAIATNNHGIFQIHGLRLLCNEAGPIAACDEEEQFSSRMLQQLIESQFDEYGVHTEDAPDYHSFALRTLKGVRFALYPSLNREVAGRLSKAEGIMPWFTMPDGSLANIGDSEGVGHPVKAELADSCDEPDVAPCVYHKNLVASGYAMVRAQWTPEAANASKLIVTGTSHEHGHDHADELSFILYHHGRPIFVDSGKYGYEQDEHREYFLNDVAHNTVGIEGRSFSPRETRSRGSSLISMIYEEDSYIITGRVIRGDSLSHTRTLRYIPVRHLLVLDDEWSIPAGAKAVSRLHLAPNLSAKVEGASVLISDEAGGQVGTIAGSSEYCLPEIARGQEDPTRLGWFSPAYLQVGPTTSISFVCEANQRTLSLVLDLAPSEQ